MYNGIIYAVLAALAFGIWAVFQEQASSHINNLFGAILISATGAVLGLIILLPKLKNTELYSNPKGLVFAILAGFCVLAIDYFTLRTYNAGTPVSIGAPIIIGGSIAVASLIGFFLGESFSWLKALGLGMVIGGSAILASLT